MKNINLKLIIFIIALSLIIFGLIGYFAYNYNKHTYSDIVGKYAFFKNEEGPNYCGELKEITLNNDKTFTYSEGLTCGSGIGPFTGTYKIKNNRIILNVTHFQGQDVNSSDFKDYDMFREYEELEDIKIIDENTLEYHSNRLTRDFEIPEI